MTNYFIKIKSYLFPKDRTEAIKYLESVYAECNTIMELTINEDMQAYMIIQLSDLHADIEEYKKETERWKKRHRNAQ